jgi:hypothetical protein
MIKRTAHVAVYDTLADWEVGHLLAELRSGRFTGIRFDIVAVAESREPITTMGGVRMLPDALIADLDPAGSDLRCHRVPGSRRSSGCQIRSRACP